MKTIVVISHLRWNFVFQRPQHLLSRLAKHCRIVFVEEPMRSEEAAHLETSEVLPNLTVVRPKTPLGSAGFADDQLVLLGTLLEQRLPLLAGSDYVLWFYTPMALPLVDRLQPAAIVYDCMDELSAFAGAPRELREREAELLELADLVLTGGPSLYEAKRNLNPRVLCLPSSVDARHFAPGPHAADDPWTRRARELQGGIAEPRLGFFGVIDERMDLSLIERLADADPAWSVVMVGPVVKIDPQSLPRRPNLHWLGQQPYELLPRLIDGWQVGLLPFARNEATRFISPTKTLEYMAAGKPVVSTAIRDVSALYGDVVRMAHSHDDFIAGCLEALSETAGERRKRMLAMMASVSRSSWDRTATTVHRAIESVLSEKDDELVAPAARAAVAGYRPTAGADPALAARPARAAGSA